MSDDGEKGFGSEYAQAVAALIEASGFQKDGSHTTPEAAASRRSLLSITGILAKSLGEVTSPLYLEPQEPSSGSF